MANPNRQYLSYDYFGMDDDLMNYTVSPSTLKIQSVTESPYNVSSLNPVYQSLPPVQGPMPFVGPPYSEWSNMNNMSDQQFDQFMTLGDSLGYADFDTTGAITQNTNMPFLPIPENIQNLEGMGPRNPFLAQGNNVYDPVYDPNTIKTVYPPTLPPSINTESGNVGASTYYAGDFDTEQEMMMAGAEGLGWKATQNNTPPNTAENKQMLSGAESLGWTGMSSDPIVSNIPSTASVDTSNTMLAGAPVSTGVGRDVGIGPSYGGAIDDVTSFDNVSKRISPPSADLKDMDLSLTDVSKGQIVDPNAGGQGLLNLTNTRENYLKNIKSVPAGSINASEAPLEEPINFDLLKPSITGEDLMNNPEYRVGFEEYGIGGGGTLTDVIESDLTGPPTGIEMSGLPETVASVPQESVIDKLGGPANIIGGGMMALGNINAAKQYDNALDDIRDGLNEIPNMIGETTQDALSQIDDTRSILDTSIGKAETSANQSLLASLDKLKKPRNAVGNIRTASNDIRKNLSKGLDSVIESAQERLNAQINTINENKRDQLASIDALKETLKAKEDELEKERKQSQIGTAVGVGSIFADAVLPGSGAVLRTGWNQYASRT